ncbi:MAG: glycosyltransferase, partial [Flavobacteriaceae bacterium]
TNSYGLEKFILTSKYTTPKKINVIGKRSSNDVDSTHFDPKKYASTELSGLRDSYGITENDFVYVFVGRLVKDKGINELVAAFDSLSKKHKDIKLLLVGMYEKELDPLDDSTNHIIESNPAIITTGTQPDVRPFYAMSDLLTFPSYREGFPNVVMEAGSMGLPGLVSDINGCNEIITEGENGCIVPPKSASELESRMEELLLDPGKLKRLAQNARPMIQERFERHFVWGELLREYKTLLKIDQ